MTESWSKRNGAAFLLEALNNPRWGNNSRQDEVCERLYSRSHLTERETVLVMSMPVASYAVAV